MVDLQKIRVSLLSGEVVIVPTETVYGLLVLEKYKQKLNQLKQRPEEVVFANIFSSIEKAKERIISSPEVDLLIKSLLPGPFTIIIESKNSSKIGIRIPDHLLFLEIIRPIEEDMVMTSANLHGHPPAVSYEEATALFPSLLAVDGGRPKYGKPSMLIEVKSR